MPHVTQPANQESSPHNESASHVPSGVTSMTVADLERDPFNTTIYIPCHFDFSQIEHVAPFLDRYGGKIFIYRWHALYDKMKYYYETAYPPNAEGVAKVTVHPMSPRDLVLHILAERKKKIVFIMTASLAYPFGQFQKEILGNLQQRFPDRVSNLNIIGHCMYGCMSCKGSEFKVPIYFTRFFSNRLPYTPEDVKKWYFDTPCPLLKDGPAPKDVKTVLVAASTGETSILVQRPILDHMYALQHVHRTHRFVWKLHPSNYNIGDYDVNYAPHAEELKNLTFIRSSFEVTDEWKPSLLPFLKTFPILLCDLHSTVAFMASYFAPKTILAWHNDADYEAVRDPAFVKNLNVFHSLEELTPLLADIPAPKGDKKFFLDLYGEPDGTEEIRFGALAKWPKVSEDNGKRCTYDARQQIAEVTEEWYAMLEKCEKETSSDPERAEELEDCKTALGLPATSDFHQESLPAPSNQTSSSSETTSVKVLSLNMWHGGEGKQKTPEQVAAIIRASGASLVGLQETHSKPAPPEGPAEYAARRDLSLEVAKALGASWQVVPQGYPLAHPGCLHPTSILVKDYKIVSHVDQKWGVRLKDEKNPEAPSLLFLNTHLPYFPYEPFAVMNIPYDNQPVLKTAEEVTLSAKKSRQGHIDALIRAATCDEKTVVILTGDFNEPSRLDWTAKSTLAGYAPFPVTWPATEALRQAGFVDTYRAIYPDAHRQPGFTWSTLSAETDARDHWDRIDFIFVKSSQGVTVKDVRTIGGPADVDPDWVSDHLGVVADLALHQ